MSYESIDPVIRAWAEKHGFALFDGVEGMQAHSFRSVYVSSDNGECFQIWVDQPESGQVSIHAADIETHLDVELRQDWSVPLEQLDKALEDAFIQVQHWMTR